MHVIATLIPQVIRKLPLVELVARADKVASLVKMSRDVLGLNDTNKGRPATSA
jgi:hypothetical protein